MWNTTRVFYQAYSTKRIRLMAFPGFFGWHGVCAESRKAREYAEDTEKTPTLAFIA